MTHSFYLKHPQKRTGKKPSLIYFTCYFSEEDKKFVYSTGEHIKPIHWNFQDYKPKLKGKLKDVNASSILTQLNRYSNKFYETEAIQTKI